MSVIGGMYWMGPQGALVSFLLVLSIFGGILNFEHHVLIQVGPIILCCFLAMMNLALSMT